MARKYDSQAALAAPLPARRRPLSRPSDLAALRPGSSGGDAVSEAAHALFAARVPEAFVDLIDWDDPDDPIARQVWPDARETRPTPGFGPDPLGEQAARHPGGLVHRYGNRALLITTGACAVHCRYCFRRHFPYGESLSGNWEATLAYLADNPQVSELILSGGDPLMLPVNRLRALTDGLASLRHLRRLRIHSRVPLAAPDRIDTPLLDWLSALPWPVTLVIHTNHAAELGTTGVDALQRLRPVVRQMLNQSVLLAGVNDQVETLVELSEALFDHGVLPYYLHQLDPVKGAAHFEVSDEQARELYARLRESLPGYLVPRLVRDTPGSLAKMPV